MSLIFTWLDSYDITFPTIRILKAWARCDDLFNEFFKNSFSETPNRLSMNAIFMVRLKCILGWHDMSEKISATVACKSIYLYNCVYMCVFVCVYVRVNKYRDITCACDCEECHSSLHMYTHTRNKIRFLACFVLLLLPLRSICPISVTPAPVSRFVVVDRDQRHGENK